MWNHLFHIPVNRTSFIFLTVPLPLVIGLVLLLSVTRFSQADSLCRGAVAAKLQSELFQQAQHHFPYSQEVDALCNSKKRCDDQRATCCSLQERRWALPSHDAPAKKWPWGKVSLLCFTFIMNSNTETYRVQSIIPLYESSPSPFCKVCKRVFITIWGGVKWNLTSLHKLNGTYLLELHCTKQCFYFFFFFFFFFYPPSSGVTATAATDPATQPDMNDCHKGARTWTLPASSCPSALRLANSGK